MVIKRIILSLGLLCFFATTGFANYADTTTKLLDVAVATNPYLKGLKYIPTFTVYNKTLFVINGNKLVQIDLQTGAVSLNKVVTDFLKKLPKDTSYVSQLRVTENEYYLTVFFDLYRITTAGEVTKLYSMSRFFEDIFVLKDKLIVGSIETVDLISKDGKRLNAWPFPDLGLSGYIKGERGLYYTENQEDSVLEFQSNGEISLSINKYFPLSGLEKIKYPFLSYVSDKYFIVFPYEKRNSIYVIKRDLNKNEVYKTIAVKGANLIPSAIELQNEEGEPNLKIDYSNNVYYIVSLIKGKLKVLSFTV